MFVPQKGRSAVTESRLSVCVCFQVLTSLPGPCCSPMLIPHVDLTPQSNNSPSGRVRPTSVTCPAACTWSGAPFSSLRCALGSCTCQPPSPPATDRASWRVAGPLSASPPLRFLPQHFGLDLRLLVTQSLLTFQKDARLLPQVHEIQQDNINLAERRRGNSG